MLLSLLVQSFFLLVQSDECCINYEEVTQTLDDIIFVACYLFIQLNNVNLRKVNSVLCSLVY